MKELLELIVRSLVDRPDDVRVEERRDEEDGKRLELSVAAEDLGKVIGKQGRTARSIRTLVGVAAERRQERVVVEILE